MGNQPVKPDKDAEEILLSRVDEACGEAADAIVEADAILFCTGAGWSADSGLAVYRDIAKVEAYAARDVDYRDLCVPRWLKEDPALFWGFWGSRPCGFSSPSSVRRRRRGDARGGGGGGALTWIFGGALAATPRPRAR